ncbi:ABC transporter substrate-binding protein [Marasmitruncus massiliensis]|uniref:ABC transporter substrate-binding protein n=1 Tax=Marasmitruncus massiliensis TaxID=1944642 RepID=UPI000C7E459F|nr:spermidine/putrescine ABC transporter substrate-binding protein [Marasmitruncus massiliensis]
MKKFAALVIAAVAVLSLSVPAYAEVEVADESYYTRFQGQGKTLNVHNWGEYIADGSDDSLDVVKEFEELTGIQVNYTTFSTNEEVYARLRNGGANYDLLIPSDYMIARMIRENMLEKLDFSNIPNFRNINQSFLNPVFDPTGEYSVPYTWGTVGVIYNKEMVDEEDLGSWDLLWNEKYMGQILMFANPRDDFGIALKRLGYPMNPENTEQLAQATDELKKQKLLVQAYVMDEVFDKMIGGEAAIAPYYAGDAITMMVDNPNLDFFVPNEGTNRFVDAMVIPKGAKNKECAEMFINFLLEAEVGASNIEYIGYSSPNDAALAILPPEITENPVAYPPEDVIAKTEFWKDLSPELNLAVDDAWTELLSSDDQYSRWLVPVFLIVALGASITINVVRARRKRRERGMFGTNYPARRL